MQIERYTARISGPLLEWIDLHLEVPAVAFQELSAQADGTPSAVLREQVSRARVVRQRRFGGEGLLNSRMSTRQLRRFCQLDDEGRTPLKTAMEELGLAARAHDRILRVARTIADLAEAPAIKAEHVVEAISSASAGRGRCREVRRELR